MDCEQYLDLMSTALDGECSAGERRELDSHLAACPQCAALFKTLSGQSSALRELDCQVPDDLTGRIMANLPEQKKPGKVIHWRRWGTVAACLVLVAAVGFAAPRGMKANNSAAPMTADSDLRSGNASPNFYGAPAEGADSGPDAAADPGALPETPGYDLAPNTVYGQASQHCFFDNQQAIRVSYGATPAAPSALVIGSAEELSGYLALFGPQSYDGDGSALPMEELDALAETYTEEFFETRRLLCVVVEAPSGSNRYEIAPQGLLRDSVTVLEISPEAGTCDMAAWLLTAEVDTMFHGGDALEVVVTR